MLSVCKLTKKNVIFAKMLRQIDGKSKTMSHRFTLLFFAIMAFTCGVSAQQTFDVDLWGGSPRVKSVEKSDKARLHVYLPADSIATGRAVVICPGGSYAGLAIDNEGTGWVPFFNNQGIAAIVLEYRLPRGKKEIPISDAEQAIRYVRKKAVAWKVNPHDVGIMGSSAGGHLASVVATQAPADARPDFQILFYPVISMVKGATHMESHDNFFGKKKKVKEKDEEQYCSDLRVSRNTPRACILLANDDTVVPALHGLNYFKALQAQKVPATLLVYPDGGHGFGSQKSFAYHFEMELDLQAWLESF